MKRRHFLTSGFTASVAAIVSPTFATPSEFKGETVVYDQYTNAHIRSSLNGKFIPEETFTAITTKGKRKLIEIQSYIGAAPFLDFGYWSAGMLQVIFQKGKQYDFALQHNTGVIEQEMKVKCLDVKRVTDEEEREFINLYFEGA